MFRRNNAIISLTAVGLGLAIAQIGNAADAKWVCSKNGKTLFFSDSDSREKKSTCQKDGGTWNKQQAKAEEPAPSGEQPETSNDSGSTSSGGGGGW